MRHIINSTNQLWGEVLKGEWGSCTPMNEVGFIKVIKGVVID